MPTKLKHLPTKPTSVHPKSGTPFIRINQHYNPNKEKPQEPNTAPAETVVVKTNETKSTWDETPSGKGVKQQKAFRERLQKINNGIPHEQVTTTHEKPKMGFLQTAEREFNESISTVIDESQIIPQSKKTTNGVYRINKGTDTEGYYKPDSQADTNIMGYIRDNFSGREAMAYEMSKMLGVEGLIPPTQLYSPDIANKGLESKHGKDTRGSLMMSAQKFGEKHLELSDVGQAFIATGGDKGLKKSFGKIKNLSDMVTFDFISGNTDRHSLNYFIGKSGDEYHAIGIDHGFTFPEHPADKMGKEYDWNNTIEH